MTTAEPSRLDRIERILEQQQQQFAQFQQQQQAAAERIDRQLDALATNQIEERDQRLVLRNEVNVDVESLFETIKQTNETVDRLAGRVDQLTTNVDQLGGRVDQLTADVGELRITIESVAQEAQQDRSQAAVDRAEFRSTVEQLLQVLTRQFNGNGNAG